MYVYLPEGFEEIGFYWFLLKALYGLRRSPRLCQLEFGSWLQSRGFTKVPDDPCVYTSEYAIVIFYVDDVVALSFPANRNRIGEFEKDLMENWIKTSRYGVITSKLSGC